MPATTALWLALAVVPSPVGPPAAAQDRLPEAQAPDGARGFGAGLDPEALRRALRAPAPADARFLDGLWALARDVELLASLAAKRYEQLGYFVWVDDRAAALEHDLNALHAGFRAQERQALQVTLGEERGLALGRAMADAHFQARMHVLVGSDHDIRQLRGALSVLVVHVRGRAELLPGVELDELTTRADLAAARLRAARADLDALHQPARPAAPDDVAAVLRLARALALGGDPGAARLLAQVRQRAREEAEQLSPGHLALFDRTHAEALRGRDRRSRIALRDYGEMLRILPLSPEGLLPTDLEGRNSDRYRQAADTGLEAARNDPLIPEIQYMLGQSFDFFAGRERSLPRFDRYLALRGIRHWDHRTFQGRALTVQERWALYVVADWTPPEDG